MTTRPAASLVRAGVQASVLGLLALAPHVPAAHAQLSSEQRACLNGVNTDAARVAKAQGAENRGCVDAAGKGTLGGPLRDCQLADPRGRVATAAARTLRDESRLCGTPPPFGYTSGGRANDVARRAELVVTNDVFGATPETALAVCASDSVGCRCQRQVYRRVERVSELGARAFVRCKRDASTTAATAGDIGRCVDDPLAPGSVAAARATGGAVAAEVARLGADIAALCDATGATAGAFPGACSGRAGDALRDCLADRSACRTCQIANDADGLSVDCDALDDGVANGSCSRNTPVCLPGETRDCNAVAAVWNAGATAVCAPSGARWDVSACSVTAAGSATHRIEVVYPRQRDPWRWQNARCNYEGDFVFDVRMNEVPTDTWEIVLEGGGQCFRDETDDCRTRELWKVAPYKTTAPGDPYEPYPPDATVSEGNATRTYSNDAIVRNANVVYTNYCSSDLWTGTNTDQPLVVTYHDPRTDTDVTRPWVFTGRYNVRAMLDVLVERYGLDDGDPALKVHFRGQSAGGVGVINNAWIVRQYLPHAASAHRVMVSSWQGFSPPDWDPRNYPFQNVDDFWAAGIPGATGRAAAAIATGVWGSELMPACLAGYPGVPDCLQGSRLYEYVANEPGESPAGLGMPVLIFQNRQDLVWTSEIGMKPLKETGTPPDQLTVRTAFLGLIDDEMGLTPGPRYGRIAWLHAPNDPTVDWNGPGRELTVHPPLDYFDAAPQRADPLLPSADLKAMTDRFWSHVGDPAWRDHGEVIAADCNWVVQPFPATPPYRDPESSCY